MELRWSGVFHGFSQICTPEGQEDFGFPALFPVLWAFFWTIPEFCTLFRLEQECKTEEKGYKTEDFARKTPNLPVSSPEFLEDFATRGVQKF